MSKLKVKIDYEALTKKPDGKERAKISKRIPEKMYEVTVEELADIVGNKGHTFLPAYLDGVRDTKHFVSQKVFALDFDGTISISEFMERTKTYEVKPAFVYETLTSTSETYKFRAVFINDLTVETKEAAEIIIKLLRRIFPESDKACTDVSRMFFGGKGVIHIAPDNKIDICNLAIATQAYMKADDPTNYARNIQRFGKKNKINIKDNMLCIHRRVKSEMEDFEANTSIIIENAQESSNFYVIDQLSQHHPICMQGEVKKNNNYKIRGIEENMLVERCQLCKDFFATDLSHDVKFFIATNFLQLKNGRNIFFKAPIESLEKWDMTWDYIKKNEYKAGYCNYDVCPYYETCQAKTIIEKVTNKMQKITSFECGPVEESESLLRDFLERAVVSNDQDIHLIKAQTAIGKTTAYCNLVRDMPHKTFMIVLPTNILQEQVAKDLEDRGVEIYVTPNIKKLTERIGLKELSYKIEELYDAGFGQKVKPLIKEYIGTHEKELSVWQKEQLEDYLDMKNQFDGKKCIVTTHALFLAIEYSVLQQYEIIIDEDILMTIFKNTSSITFEELREAKKHGQLGPQCMHRICDLMDSQDGSVQRLEKIELDTLIIEKIYEQNLKIDSSLVDFLQADSYHVDLQDEKIDFFNSKKIPDIKLTVVSATPVEELYRAFTRGRYIKVYEVPIAKYKGKLKQYTAHSLSRSNMEQIGIGRLKEEIYNVTQNSKIASITFKKFSEGNPHYYGNTEGLNNYKGKDLAVIGTPHNVPFIYKLLGKYLGFAAEENLCQRFVEHNGYQFKFMTYADEKMRMLQFY